jgi:dihydroorotate dehydrogenase (fumarate)
VLFNRIFQSDVDLETLEATPRLAVSTPEELRLCLRWIGILRGQSKGSLAATSGVRRGEDVLKLLLAGADAAMLATALLQHGPRLLCQIERDLVEWLDFRGYDSVEQLKGSLSRRKVGDPAAFERGSYMRALKTFSSSFLV